MSLSNDLISQFVKVTNDSSEKKKETTTYGTIKRDESSGNMYVKLDGSDTLTPIVPTVNTHDGDRVVVMIKNHTAYVTGNISSPAARMDDIGDIKDAAEAITELQIVVARKVDTEEFTAEKARIDDLYSENITIKESLTANEADIDDLQADNITIREQLTADQADISELKTSKLDADLAEITYAKVEDLEATDLKVHNLEATYGEFSELTTKNFEAVNADIDKLETDKLSAEEAKITYANIDFTNITKAAMEYFYSQSGLIENVVIGDATISGYLIGVTIKGDLLEANTVVADKLVIKGEDGLYYKLNTDGVTTEAEQTEYNSLNGEIITAKSITATKINVDDLVAFDATIGGFNITNNSIYSGVKDTVDNATRGIYLDSDGQMAVGDDSNFIKYYKDTDGTYKLIVSASSVIFSANNKSVETVISEEVDNVRTRTDEIEAKVVESESLIRQLSDSISVLVTDGNGTSLMTQTEDGWIFSTAEIQSAINATSESLDSLTNELGNTNGAVDILQQAVDDLGELAEYVKIGTYEDEPCIELGESDSDFKLRITNTRVIFTEGSVVLAYFNNQSLHIKKAVVEEELQQGGFVWKARSNGNLGLIWKGGI